jgi:hypothetical protein
MLNFWKQCFCWFRKPPDGCGLILACIHGPDLQRHSFSSANASAGFRAMFVLVATMNRIHSKSGRPINSGI